MIDYKTPCGALSAKPQGWRWPQYPKCNRPVGHKLPHVQYDHRTAEKMHEWYEAMDLDATDLRNALKRAAKTERERIYGNRTRY